MKVTKVRVFDYDPLSSYGDNYAKDEFIKFLANIKKDDLVDVKIEEEPTTYIRRKTMVIYQEEEKTSERES